MLQWNALVGILPVDASVVTIREGWATFMSSTRPAQRTAAAELMKAAESEDYEALARLAADFNLCAWSGVPF